MKNIILFISIFFAISSVNGQNVKSPGLMLGLDSTVVVLEYANFNNLNSDEQWEKISTPGRIVYYCLFSNDKNKSNVAHIYDFDEKGINIKYTTITTQEKIKYAVDFFNNLSAGNFHPTEFKISTYSFNDNELYSII
jgi:hypothetical protein